MGREAGGRHRLALVVAGLLVAAGTAAADPWHYVGSWLDLAWNLSARVAYDDNVFNATSGRRGDLITTVGLDSRIGVRHPLGSFTLFYRLDHEQYLVHDELTTDDVGQNQSLSFGDTLRLTPRDRITYDDAFSRTPDLLYQTGRFRAARRPPVDAEGVVLGHGGVIANTAHVGYRHDFRAPLYASLDATYGLEEFDDPAQVDSRSGRVSLGLGWRLSPLRSLGLELSHAVTAFDAFDGTESDVAALTFEDAPWPTWRLRARVGASFNATPQDSVDTVTPDLEVHLDKELRRGAVSLGYQRSVATTQGVGAASEAQSLALQGSYQHTPVWRSTVGVTLSERRSRSDAAPDLRRLTVRYTTGYPLGRLLTLTGGYLFSTQSQEARGGLTAGRVTNNRVFVGLRYGATLL